MAAKSGKRRSFYTDLDHLRKCFDNVDHDRSGFIGYNELTKLVQIMPDAEDSVVPELMDKLDRDKDGKVSFDDFVWLFEMEREAASKKQKLDSSRTLTSKGEGNKKPSPHHTVDSDNTAFLTSPSDTSYGDNTGEVVLRKNPRRMTLPSKLHRHGRDLSFLSPIKPEKSPAARKPPSSDVTDLASQMRYLTDASESTDSPQLRRNSKVLSWIESGDMLFEDMGTGPRDGDDLPSPPLSPTPEASHVGSILEAVCSTKDISSTSIAKLCDHVKADAQEQQELLALLHHLDKEKKGCVSAIEFAQGLQAIKNSASVGPLTPTHQIATRKGFRREVTPPTLSESFGSPSHQGAKPPPVSSTPMMPSSARHFAVLTSIDMNQSGFMKVDEIVNYLQDIGIEAPQDQSLENILTETLPVDPSGRISVEDLTASLEGSIVTEGKSQNVLRQVALKSFKNEISTLRTQILQVSMERDKLKSSLNRTVEEKQKLIAEGDEHVEMVTKKSEKEIKEQEDKYVERIKEVEKNKQQEQEHLQERATNAIKDLEAKMKELKGEEEKLREDLKFALEDANQVTQQLSQARKELNQKDRMITMLQKDLGSRSEHDIIDDESQMKLLVDLENELSEKKVCIDELQDKMREVQDKCDELKAENERIRQKNMAQKRSLLKSQSLPTNPRGGSGWGHKKRSKHPRPLSGSHFHRRSMPLHPPVPTSMDLDLAVHKKDHPVLMEVDQEEFEEEDEEMFPHLPPGNDSTNDTSGDDIDGDPYEEKPPESGEQSTDTEEDDFAKSTTSLMEEFRQDRLATLERKLSQDLTKKHEEIVTQLKQEIFRLEEFSESQQELSLKLEEEKSQVSEELKEMKYDLESERKSHEVEVNILSRKLENAENDVTKLESDLKCMYDERRLLQEKYKAELTHAEKSALLKISALKSKLEQMSSVISDQSTQQAELLQLKENLVRQKEVLIQQSSDDIAKLEKTHLEQTQAIKSKHNAIVEELRKELKDFELRETELKDKLESREKELEAITNQVTGLSENETVYRGRISSLEANEVKYLSEVSQLKTDVAKLQKDNSHMKSVAVTYKNKISSLKAELQREAEFADISLQSTSRRSSTSSESSRHGEIITRMREQLEELQKVLEFKSTGNKRHQVGSTVPEIELIEKLLSNSKELDVEVQKMQQRISAERQSHLQVCTQKDEHLHSLQVEKETQNKSIRRLAADMSKDLTSHINSLQYDCSQSIQEYREKIDEALLRLESISKCLNDKEVGHASALNNLSSALEHSHNEISKYKEEISGMQQELQTSRINFGELNESHDQLTMLHRERGVQMDELRSMLEQFESDDVVKAVPNDVVSSRNVKVDADSGQVITEHDESQTRDEVLLQRDETIHALREEIERLKLTEGHIKLINEDANRTLFEKETEMKQTQKEVESLQSRTKELKLKLEQQAHECKAYREEVTELKKSFKSATEELKASKGKLELQHRLSIKQLKEKHESEMKLVHQTVAENISDAKELYNYLLTSSVASGRSPVTECVTQLNHSQCMTGSVKEVDRIRDEFLAQQKMCSDLEATLAGNIEEHELLEGQFTAEHEEEVRALRQQKQHLIKKLEDVEEQYQTILDDQEQQHSAVLQQLMQSEADAEKQLKEKTEEAFHVYQQVADISEEKKVLVDIIKQLCIEAGRHIDVV